MRFLASITWPCAVLSRMSLMSSTRPRSSSRSRTMIGYSLPDSRKNAACVPPTLVRIEFGDARD